VIEKILEILEHALQKDINIDVHDERIDTSEFVFHSAKAEIFRNKIKAISKMMKFLKTLRQEKHIILQLKGLCPDNKIPRGLLQKGRDAIVGAVDAYEKAKAWDIQNEKRPN
jgi:hypothetical protein